MVTFRDGGSTERIGDGREVSLRYQLSGVSAHALPDQGVRSNLLVAVVEAEEKGEVGANCGEF